MKRIKLTTLALSLILLTAALAGCSSPYADGDIAPGNNSIMDPGSSYPHYSNEPGENNDSYLVIDENRQVATAEASMLTFALKVDTAAYSNVERYINNGTLPPKDAVRTEELINYFRYDEHMTFGDGPFSIYTEVGPSPFDKNKHMAFIRVKTEDIDRSELPPCNFTFLIDTSGSMAPHDRLPLLQDAFGMLIETLTERDTVSIVTYAGSAGVLIDSVSGADKDTLTRAVNGLAASGSTAGSRGIQTAYELAEKNFLAGGNNRVILATDGDFNVGTTSLTELEKLISEKSGSGIYLSLLGVGSGGIRHDIMETLAKHGSGNYNFLHSLATAQKVLVDEMAANLFTVADDVKAQIEFNPSNVKSYRLIGYENRRLSNRDFDDDTKDAGEIGAGTEVVVLFEIELNDGFGTRYTPAETPDFADELFDVRIRYKNPGQNESNLLTQAVTFDQISSTGSNDLNFASAVAAFCHLLRGSEYIGGVTAQEVVSLAERSLGQDTGGYRQGFISLVERYRNIHG
jgi:Ca-activated chloride channel family protein